MTPEQVRPSLIVRGHVFPEPIQVIVANARGAGMQIIGRGTVSNQVFVRILMDEQLSRLEASPEMEAFDGNAKKLRLGIQTIRLGLAYDYDPFFSLSIACVDPLPYQLEAVYEHSMKLPRIRFLLADDPGAGKTIMAGLLIKELKIRDLIKRILVITPANLTFQWQRELKDKFRETFEIVRDDVLRANYASNPWQDKNQLITSVSWGSRVEYAKESLLPSVSKCRGCAASVKAGTATKTLPPLNGLRPLPSTGRRASRSKHPIELILESREYRGRESP